MIEHDTPLPITYRAELLQRIMPSLRAGECCSLIGVSGVGKSNLARFLRQLNVQMNYWDEASWVVVIDTHGLVFGEQPTEYMVTELMIHQLIREAERRGLSAEFVGELDTLHARLVAQPSAHLALRYLERICARLCEAFGLRLVFVFDQFEDLWKTIDARFFLNLRHLRDQFKYQLVYFVITRERLERIRQDVLKDTPAVEAFWELFSSHTYGLGMYSEADANLMVERLARRQGVYVEDRLRDTILDWSGRHPGLLRGLFWSQQQSAETSAHALLRISAVAEECAKIWNDLIADEQHIARILAASLPLHQPQSAALADLQFKEIIKGTPPALFSPIFSAYVLRQAGIDVAGIVIDPHLRQVWLDGQLLAQPLSPLEFSLLEYLARYAGTVCKRQDILEALYHESNYDAGDERLDTLLRRLREALNEDARHPRYLVTHRGVGFRLVQGYIQE